MGKKNFAVSASGDNQVTEVSRYGNELTVWVRGWTHGLEIQCKLIDGEECFEIYATGGSLAKSNGYKQLLEVNG